MKCRLATRPRSDGYAVAAIRNFATAATTWFQYDFGRFNMILLPISFAGSNDTQLVASRSSQAEQVAKFISEIQETATDDDDPDYSVALRIDTRFVKTDAADALNVRISRDASATPVRLEEDDYLSRFPYTYQTLIAQLRRRYDDFKLTPEFHLRLGRLRAEVDGFCKERLLNPKNPKSSRTRFYHSKAVEQFDQFYSRKTKTG